MRPSFRYEPAKKNTVKSTSATRALPVFVALITAGLISAPAPQANAQTSKARSAAAKEKALTRQERESARAVQANDSAIGASPSDTPTLPARQWKVSLKELGVGRPVSLRGVESEASVGVGVRRDEIVEAAKLRLTFTLSPALIPSLSHLKLMLNDETLQTVVLDKERPVSYTHLTLPTSDLV